MNNIDKIYTLIGHKDGSYTLITSSDGVFTVDEGVRYFELRHGFVWLNANCEVVTAPKVPPAVKLPDPEQYKIIKGVVTDDPRDDDPNPELVSFKRNTNFGKEFCLIELSTNVLEYFKKNPDMEFRKGDYLELVVTPPKSDRISVHFRLENVSDIQVHTRDKIGKFDVLVGEFEDKGGN